MTTEESREVAEARAELWVTLPDWVVDVGTIAAAQAVNESIDRLIEAVRKDERRRVYEEFQAASPVPWRDWLRQYSASTARQE